MNVKDNRKRDKKKISEIKPGTLFKLGDLYFIRTDYSVYRERTNIVGLKCCVNTSAEYEFNNWYEPVNAISVLDGMPYSFSSKELIEVFPKAVICLDEEKTNA